MLESQNNSQKLKKGRGIVYLNTQILGGVLTNANLHPSMLIYLALM